MAVLLTVFIISVVFSVCAVLLVLRISHKKKWYDNIDERKIHSGEIPRLGGIGFVSAFFLIASGIGIVYGIKGVNVTRFIPCGIAMGIVMFSGAYDDFRPMSPHYKFLLQVVAAILIISFGFNFDRLLYNGGGFLTDLGYFSIPITLLWIVGLTNAFNMIDGVDGLAGGVSVIIAFFLGLIYFYHSDYEISKSVVLCVCLIGVLVGFLFFNSPFPRAKIFMGDCGSQFLGFTLALLPLMKEADRLTSLPLFYVAALFLIPIYDTTAAVWRRVRDGKHIYDPDKSHLHHKLINMGLSAKKVDAVIFSVQIIIGVFTFIAIQIEGVKSLIILGAVYLFTLVFFTVIHFINRAVLLKNNGGGGGGNPTPASS
ncbi:MAG: undecaprenyl/decaprenyl-phosphate alpha-N-acetylglucosaminyl 1-phosphate transferase [Treponema sp.]|jgi:UDP-GlcNAc:undecaprenyl-phosphate GlcNAc-1-phosphate transferase|nr:undecaprenyl/decaprenyl-phosphate alpha-N-acetylglucosaminyl 1-phosphate transferase [Treponema sp.]